MGICADVEQVTNTGIYLVTCLECHDAGRLRRNESFVCSCGHKYKLRVIAVESVPAEDNAD